MTTYGSAELRAEYPEAGYVTAVTVTRADPVIGVDPALLARAAPWVFPNGDWQVIQLDTAGQYRYRLVGTDSDRGVLIYERTPQPEG